MKNHFDLNYEFETETGERRYIASMDCAYSILCYDTYPVAVRAQLEENPELLCDYDFMNKYRICMNEYELCELKIKQLEKKVAEGKISINTHLGVLEACIGGNPDYPEIFTYIRRPDGIEVDLVAVEVKKEENIARAYLYGDTMTDSYTTTNDWSADEINVEVKQ